LKKLLAVFSGMANWLGRELINSTEPTDKALFKTKLDKMQIAKLFNSQFLTTWLCLGRKFYNENKKS